MLLGGSCGGLEDEDGFGGEKDTGTVQELRYHEVEC